MLETKIEGARDLAFILSEGNGKISREAVLILSGTGKLEAGTVLARLPAINQYVPATGEPVPSMDGAEIACAVLAYGVDATNHSVTAVVIARQAEVKTPMLIFGPSIDDESKKLAALAQLAAATIIPR